MVPTISADMALDEVFRRWPRTQRVFNGRGLLCPGCPITPWHTVRDACAEYGLDERSFLAELQRAAGLAA